MKRLDLTGLSSPRERRTRRRPGGRRPVATDARSPDYERRIRADASLSDLDLELAESFLKGTASGDKPVIEALRDYGLVEGEAPEWRITNAALLLFAGASARHWNPGAGIRVIRVAGTARLLGHRRSVTGMAYAGPPLASAIGEGLRLAGEQIGSSEPLRRIFFRDVAEYPRGAWREVVMNAIAHRDYGGVAETEIVFYDDRVEVTNPGLPVEPFTMDDLKAGKVVARTRNPLLNRVLGDKGLVRGRATGLPRVLAEMGRTLLREPEFNSSGGRFSVTLRNDPQFATSGPGWHWVVGRLRVDPDQKRILLARPDGFTEDDYRRLNTVSADEAKRRIGELVENDIVAPEPAPREPRRVYYLTADLDAQRWFLEDRIPKLQEHFRKHSRLRSADYRDLFETSYPVARRELGYFADQGFLSVGGRGRAMHYLPAAGLRRSQP